MRKFLRSISVVVLTCVVCYTHAQVVVSPARGGTGICVNNAMNRTLPYGIPVGLDTMMIRETSPGDIATTVDSIRLQVPTGWYLWNSMPYVAFINTSVTSELDSVELIYTFDHITLYLRAAHTSVLDTIILGGFGMVPIADTARTSYIYPSSSFGVAGITSGTSGTNFCNLSVSPQPVNVNHLLFCTDTATAHDATPGGTWSSTDTSVATVDPVTGFITAHSWGYDSIIYKTDTCWMAGIIRIYCEGYVPMTNSNSRDVQVFPNPARNMLTIRSASEPITNIAITNLIGQKLYNVKICKYDNVQIDVSTYPAGIYFVRVNGGEMRKFIKEEL